MNKPMRVQGTFISEEDVARLVAYCCDQAAPKFSDEAVKWLLDEATSYTRKQDKEFGYGLCLMDAKDDYYEVKSQWEFTGERK